MQTSRSVISTATATSRSSDPRRVAGSWHSPTTVRRCGRCRSPINGWDFGAPAIVDLNGNGQPVIVFGGHVISAGGQILWSTTNGYRGGSHPNGAGGIAVDLNNDGHTAVLFGASAFSSTGDLLWQNSTVGDGIDAIGQFDTVPIPTRKSSSWVVAWCPYSTTPANSSGGLWDFPAAAAEAHRSSPTSTETEFPRSAWPGAVTMLFSTPMDRYAGRTRRRIRRPTARPRRSSISTTTAEKEIIYGDELYLRAYGQRWRVALADPKLGRYGV